MLKLCVHVFTLKLTLLFLKIENKRGRQSSTKWPWEKSSLGKIWRKSWSNWSTTGSHRKSWAVDKALTQQWSVHGTPKFRRSNVISRWPFSALWYMASCKTFTWDLVNIFGSSVGLVGGLELWWIGFLPGVCCWTPSANISSRESTSLDEGVVLNGCDKSLWRIVLWPCEAATDMAL